MQIATPYTARHRAGFAIVLIGLMLMMASASAPSGRRRAAAAGRDGSNSMPQIGAPLTAAGETKAAGLSAPPPSRGSPESDLSGSRFRAARAP